MQPIERSGVERAIVIGGGPAGLASAASLEKRGIPALVVDAGEAVGDSWKAHYDRLHLHTVRWLSHLPDMRIPRSEGRWVPRDGVVRYLQAYAAHHRLRVRHSTSVTSVHRSEDVWRLETDAGPLFAEVVVIATGYNREPVVPEWEGMGSFRGELFHSSRYRNGRAYQGSDVLVVGIGNSGAEIAADLVEHGARSVWVSVRTPPNILRRDLFGLPTQMVGIALRHLPGPIIDKVSTTTQKLTVGDLTPYGLRPPERGVHSRVRNEERIPLLDVGFIRALKDRAITVVGPVQRFDGDEVVLEDDNRIAPAGVVAATGFRRGLEPLVGHLGVLDKKGNPVVHGAITHTHAPNLYFIGYSNPLSGNLREIGIDARRIARSLTSLA
ncbi:MAG: flavin-containing monooxygenase [Actinomycetota bacterium]